jgi:hypothetical protein
MRNPTIKIRLNDFIIWLGPHPSLFHAPQGRFT